MASKKPTGTKAKRGHKASAQDSPIVSTQVINNHAPKDLQNGLTDALIGAGSYRGRQLSQTDTLIVNLRNYLVSNNRQLLSQAYVEYGLIQTIVNVPVDDAVRGGVKIKSKQLSADQVEKLTQRMDRDCILTKCVGQAAKWNRLFGGAGILVLTEQDPATPLNVTAINTSTRLEFRAVDMWELFWNLQNTEGVDPAGQGFHQDVEYYNYYGLRVHRSRVMAMKGLTAPSFVRPRLRGWGFSIVESLIRSINQFLKTNDLAFEVLDEFKLDIYKIKNLAQTLLGSDGTERIKQRVQLANMQKNYQNAITMDSEDSYEQKQLTWAGIADMMREFRIGIAADMRMPMTKLFGISSAGFNSGEDDIENYNAMVEGEVREKIKYETITILELLSQQEFGFAPDDLQIEFRPLRIMSSEQEENVKNARFARLIQARQAGEILTDEFRDACNQENLLGIQLEDRSLELEEEQEALAEGDNAEEPGATEEGGADEKDKSKKRLAKDAPEAKDPKTE